MKRRLPWGTLFLAFSAAGWLTVTFFGPDWPYLRAFFDASLVGALADWFAVTALFRKPAGIPLPHTDLLVRKKDELAEALPRFLATFLQSETLRPVLAELDWASAFEKEGGSKLLNALFADRQAAAWGSQALTAGTAFLVKELRTRKPGLIDPVTELIRKSAGWKGLFIGRDSVEEVVEGLLAELEALRDDHGHPLRPVLAETLKQTVLRWEAKDSPWRSDSQARERFNRQASELALALWERSNAAERLTQALTFVLRRTDARVLSERIREAVGADLQAIRVNGAVVGGIAGVLLLAASNLILGR